MIWTAHKVHHEAVTEEGYRITWTMHPVRGTFFNAYSPTGKHIDGSHDKERVKQSCEADLAKAATCE